MGPLSRDDTRHNTSCSDNKQNIIMCSFKSSEDNQKKEGGADSYFYVFKSESGVCSCAGWFEQHQKIRFLMLWCVCISKKLCIERAANQAFVLA